MNYRFVIGSRRDHPTMDSWYVMVVGINPGESISHEDCQFWHPARKAGKTYGEALRLMIHRENV